MPIPDFGGLPPDPTYTDLIVKINQLVQKLRNLMLNLDSLNVVDLTADHISAGTINANVVTIGAEDGSRYYRLDDNGIKAFNGTRNTLDFNLATGLLTLVQVLIKSAAAYPYVELDPAGNLFAAYQSATNSLKILPNQLGSPAIVVENGSVQGGMYINSILGNSFAITCNGSDLFITPGSPYKVMFPDWDRMYSTGDGQTLQQALDNLSSSIGSLSSTVSSLSSAIAGKATAGASTGSGGSHNHGIPNGTVLMVSGGGTVTFSAATGHTHSQT